MAIHIGGIAAIGAVATRGVKLGLAGIRAAASKSGLVNKSGSLDQTTTATESVRRGDRGQVRVTRTSRKSPFLTPTGSRVVSLGAAGAGYEGAKRGGKQQRKYLQ